MSRHIPAEPLLSIGLLLKAWASGKRVDDTNMQLYSHARHAIAGWVKERGVLDGTLYAPAYICAEAVDPLEDMGQRVRFYPVLNTLEPDWAWLATHLDGEAKALMLVHYFGFPNAVESALEFCRKRGILLLEDCAHSFLTRYQGQVIGTFGDAGVYSYRKMLPLPDGGGILWKVGHEGGTGVSESGGFPYREILRRLAEYGLHRAAIPAQAWGWLRAGYSRVGTSSDGIAPAPISGICLRLMKALEPDYAAIVSRRRDNYRRLADALRVFPEVTLPFGDLPEGVCPYAFPMLVEDRERLIRELQAQGVPAQGWPTLPQAVVKDIRFRMAQLYAKELMILPVHQDLGPAQIGKIAGAYRRIR